MSRNPKKVLILGSGGLRIGQAGEFDYSGSQAIKALKEEGVFTVLINPNIATVQTDADMADRVYFQPLNITTVTKIIEREKPDGILLSFGGQTALNLGLELNKIGIFKKFGVRVLGTPVETIKITEDRDLFKKALTKINILSPKSFAVYTVEEALRAASAIGYPVMMRAGYSLGGLGSGKIENKKQLKEKVHEAFQAVSQILIEEYLGGWKEIEYEVVRDKDNNTITVCNMENMDPMGIHTGESIVVAPSQTLTNEEYHSLRAVSIKIIQHLGVIGECNVQFALNSVTGEYRVIEVNARLSRSSALASKVTGYPLAFIATKLALGYKLHELKNSVTGTTSAFFEPALDYLAVKIPRWDLTKLKSSEHTIGSEMKSVGEVMALGRSFPEALQKAVRMLCLGKELFMNNGYHDLGKALRDIRIPTPSRLFALAFALEHKVSVSRITRLSGIDPWFLSHLKIIAGAYASLRAKGWDEMKRNTPALKTLKQLGFSDACIAEACARTEHAVRRLRKQCGVVPTVKQIDTTAGEFPAKTNYLYCTYHGSAHDVVRERRPAIVLGSGPYRICSSVEFDWCCVNTVKTLRKKKIRTVVVNSNPETVSTDYDISDRLYFEELTLERILDICEFERPRGLVVSMGGQVPNNLAHPWR